MSQKTQRTILLASMSSTFFILMTTLIGNADYEGSWRTESNWGAAYQWNHQLSNWSTTGVKSVLGVPVFDGLSGLGYRLPNFATTNHGSFLILLNRWVPAQALTLMLVWIAMSFCWATVDLVAQSWNGRSGFFVRLWITSFLAAALFAFGLHNDWLMNLVGLFGALSAAASLYHRGLWEKSKPRVASPSEALALFAGSMLLVASSHPQFALVVVPVLASRVSAFRYLLNCPSPRFTLLAMFGCLFFVLAVLVFELFSLHLPSGAVRPPQQNNFDFLIQGWSLGSWQQFLRSVALNSALPILLILKQLGLTDWFSWNYEFLNFASLVWLGLVLLLPHGFERLGGIRRKAIRSCLMVVGVAMVAMALSSESRELKNPFRMLLNFDGYYMQFIPTLLILVGCIIARPNRVTDGESTRQIRVLLNSLRTIGIVLGVAFPIILLVSAPTLNGAAKRNEVVSGELEVATRLVSPNGRIGDLDRDSGSGCIPTSGYLENLGVSHPLVASRFGLPTIESNAGYQSRGVSISENRYTQYCDVWSDLKGCDSRIMDFLSLGAVLARPEKSQCSWLISAPTLRELANSWSSQAGELQQNHFGNFYVSSEALGHAPGELCVVRYDCLSQARRTTVSQAQPPWNSCKDSCWFRYDVLQRVNPSLEWLVIPVRFDPAVGVRDSQTLQRLKVTNYRGLLAVNVGVDGLPQVLEASIAPDLRMYLLALIPYFSLGASVSVGLVVFRSRRRCPP